VGGGAPLSRFTRTLERIEAHPGVGAVLVELHDYDPLGSAWPRSEQIRVIGRVTTVQVSAWLAPLEADAVWMSDHDGMVIAWWD
jgi:hypothetical protein